MQTGCIEGKMIVVALLLDRGVLPWQADWYRARVEEYSVAPTDDELRLRSPTTPSDGDDEVQESLTHVVSYLGALDEALATLVPGSRKESAGVEHELRGRDGEVVVPGDAAERKGYSRS